MTNVASRTPGEDAGQGGDASRRPDFDRLARPVLVEAFVSHLTNEAPPRPSKQAKADLANHLRLLWAASASPMRRTIVDALEGAEAYVRTKRAKRGADA